jgi:Bacterial Ig-like domain
MRTASTAARLALIALALTACASPAPDALDTPSSAGGKVPPSGVQTSPANGQTSVPVDATISILFPQLVGVSRVQSAISISSSPAITCMGQLILLPQSTVNCRSQQPLQANTVYTIDVHVIQ